MIDIDNKKMWESLLNELPESDLTDAIVTSLEKQGLEWNGKEIVSIESETRYYIGVDIGDPKGDIGVKQEYRKPEPFDIEKGMWLMCIKDYSSFNNSPLLFKKGNLYQCEDCEYVKYGIGDNESYRFIACWQHFRPATPEEIPKEPKQDPCIDCKMATNNCALCCSKFKEYHSQSNQEELSEFENCMMDYYVTGTAPIEADDGKDLSKLTKEYSSKLLSIARKQIASEIKADTLVEEYVKRWHNLKDKGVVEIYENNFHITTGIYKQAIVDVLKAIEKGNNV